MLDNTTSLDIENDKTNKEFLEITIQNQKFGIPVLQIQDVLRKQSITKIPLAHSAIAGALNLRGRIVTAINVRKCLGLPSSDDSDNTMSVVVEENAELYSLIVDDIGDVLSLKYSDFQPNPATLDPVWRNVSQGVFRLEKDLLVILDISKLLETFAN